MANSSKRKGDRAEREAVELLAGLGLPVRRNFGAGRPDDIADLDIDGTIAVQVRDYADFGRACVDAATDAAHQAEVAGVAYGVGLARRRGGRWVVTMTPDTFAAIAHVLQGSRNHA